MDNGFHVYVIEPGGDITKTMLSDLEKMENVTVINRPYSIQSSLLKRIKKIHFHQKTNKYFSIPFKSIWNKYSELHKICFDTSKRNILLFSSFALQEFSVKLLNNFLKGNPDVEMVVYFSDTINSPVIQKARLMASELDFKQIYTFDPEDSKKYGFIYTNSLYSKQIVPESSKQTSDLYFVGENKGRLEILHNIHDKARKKGLATSFRILRVPDEKQTINSIIYNKRISYLEMLKEIQNTKCILDIVQENQTGTTLRYYEAVCYNKKLLTNNKSVIQLEYYDPKYIQVFYSIDSIDWEWLKSGDKVDFQYHGDYSPKCLINLIVTTTC